MGCGSSSQAGAEDTAEKTRPVQQPSPPDFNSLKWETNEAWGEAITEMCRNATDDESQQRLRDKSGAAMFNRVHEWLNRDYPQSAMAGAIANMGDIGLQTTHGPCQHPATVFMTADDHCSKVMYSASIVMAAPLCDEETGDWVVPGAYLNDPAMYLAQYQAHDLLLHMRKDGFDTDYAVMNVFIGADMTTCAFNPTHSAYTLTYFDVKPNSEFKETNKRLAKAARNAPDEFRDLFRPLMFKSVIGKRASEYPGCTIWDGGELPFSVKGVPHPYPTRPLIGRNYSQMANNVEETHWKINNPGAESGNEPEVLLKNMDPSRDPGGIISICLIVAFSPSVVWPSAGTFLKTAAFKAAEEALLKRIDSMHTEGKFQSCAVYLSMGADQSFYKYIGNRPAKVPDNRAPEETVTATDSIVVEEQALVSSEKPATEKKHPVEKAPATKVAVDKEALEKEFLDSLRAFSVTFEKQPQHELFDSESHFQEIKQQMRARAQQDPTKYDQIAIMAGFASARHFLEKNFPHCIISDEGEFPGILPDGGEMPISDTRLLVARDPKQEPKSIVAVINAVPRPGGEGTSHLVMENKSWLGTSHMQVADDMLLALLKKWHKEGKVSEVDCFAQVMMGMDATIYQFVDGERFVDYSDERMAEIKWE